MKSARMQKKAGNNVMGMIRAAGLGYEYLRYEEEGQEPEVTKAIEDVSLESRRDSLSRCSGITEAEINACETYQRSAGAYRRHHVGGRYEDDR